jgi:hypothetical protein
MSTIWLPSSPSSGCLLLVMTCCRVRHDAARALRPRLHLDKRPHWGAGDEQCQSGAWDPAVVSLERGRLAVYVTQSADFGATHGPLTGVMALLLWGQPDRDRDEPRMARTPRGGHANPGDLVARLMQAMTNECEPSRLSPSMTGPGPL